MNERPSNKVLETLSFLTNEYKYLLYCLAFASLFSCKKPYEPPAIKAENNFLVVEGVINTYPASETTVKLSHTRRLIDTVVSVPENSARVSIEDNNGASYFLTQTGAGIYKSEPLNLNASGSYRLKIITVNNHQYVSDFVPGKQNVVIDSLTWEKEKDVTIFVNTHDQQNNTRFYRWEYEETWEYHPFFDSNLGYANGQIYYRDSSNQINQCWSTFSSTDILLASTRKLSEDVITHLPVAVVPARSEKISFKYSILVKQYALTLEAFEYWQILKKNTEQLGTLFDAQPSQLTGNIHNVKDAGEPVIGFISACSIQEKRIFIMHYEVAPWEGPDYNPAGYCDVFIIDPRNAGDYLNNNTTLAPAYYVSGGGLAISKVTCIDCRLHGGSPVKPGFW